jgi:hypothetical protein
MARNPWDYHDCPEFRLTVTRWDGRGSEPVVVYERYTNGLTWSEAARSFANGLVRAALGRLRPAKVPADV